MRNVSGPPRVYLSLVYFLNGLNVNVERCSYVKLALNHINFLPKHLRTLCLVYLDIVSASIFIKSGSLANQ
jgi:hypothetical protein